MNKALTVVAKIIRKNAIEGAGAASVRTLHEKPVPAVLQKTK